MKIVSITKHKRKKNYYFVCFDEGEAVSLPDEVILRHGLANGCELTEDELNDIIKEEETYAAMDTSLHLLGFRQRSSRELRDRLRQNKISDPVIDRTATRLRELGYLNDQRFAKDYAQSLGQKGKGPYLIKAELLKKGIDRETVSEIMADFKESGEQERERLKTLAECKLRQMQGLPPRVVAQRLAGFLARRGFSPEAVHDALRLLKQELEEE
jgi:regulatory protein